MIERVASQSTGGLYFARPNKTRKFISTGAKVLDLIRVMLADHGLHLRGEAPAQLKAVA